MLTTHEVHRNGPYLRVVIPDVLPPDWGSLREDVDAEVADGGVDRITLVTPHFSYDEPDRKALVSLFSDLGDAGVDTRIEWRDQPMFVPDEGEIPA